MHNPSIAARIAKEEAEHPVPTMEPAQAEETDEEAQARQADYDRRRAEYEAEQERLASERKEAFERKQREYEAEAKRREEAHQLRLTTLERIVTEAPEAFNTTQLRFFTRLLLDLSPYGLFEEAAEHYAASDAERDKTDDQILEAALEACTDEKLTGFLLRLVLTEHVAQPREDQADWLRDAEVIFVPQQAKVTAVNKKGKSGVAKKPRTTKKAA